MYLRQRKAVVLLITPYKGRPGYWILHLSCGHCLVVRFKKSPKLIGRQTLCLEKHPNAT